MGKTIKGKDKAERKTAAAKRKIARKTKGGRAVSAIIFAVGLLAMCGCATSDSAQPAKSQTQNNTFDRCVFVMAAKAKVGGEKEKAEKVKAEADGDMPALEMFTQTQSLESTGSTDTTTQTNTQTPTTETKPDINVNYAQGGGITNRGTGAAASGFLESLTADSLVKLSEYLTGAKSGQVTVTKKDGTTETLTCEGGECTRADGTKICAACKD